MNKKNPSKFWNWTLVALMSVIVLCWMATSLRRLDSIGGGGVELSGVLSERSESPDTRAHVSQQRLSSLDDMVIEGQGDEARKAAGNERERRLLDGSESGSQSQGPQVDLAAGDVKQAAQALGGIAEIGASISKRDAALAQCLREAAEWTEPQQRHELVQRMRHIEEAQRRATAELAQQRGDVLRQEDRGGVTELIGYEGDQPVFRSTDNVNAAIATGAKILQGSPELLTGSGVAVGVWDGGSVRTTHRELTGRVNSLDGATVIDHATHVAGTIAATGIDTAAKGMATAATIDSYDWTFDTSELTDRGATYPGEAGRLMIANQSYGQATGWSNTGGTTPKWRWNGTALSITDEDSNFGKYTGGSAALDGVIVSAPYLTIFRAAGNDRYDNPSTGELVALGTSSTTVAYDPTIHPKWDSAYRNGYDLLNDGALSKNVVTVGSVNDMVTNGARDLTKANISGFSSWGPCDDGRIKPDLVANGEFLYSSLGSSDSAYGSLSGTSMASPNAAGTAALVVQAYGRRFPGQAMRASLLKGLLIHTADDVGLTGPDYQYGWGMINAERAVQHLAAYAARAGTQRLVEGRLTSTQTSVTVTLPWDGVSPIRATLCWTDPTAAAITTGNSRTPQLVNNLNLALKDSLNQTSLPWVMPYVGDWSLAKLSAAATRGVNNTDNVERVDIANPVIGTYTVTVSYSGSLTGGAQAFSLLLSGMADSATAPAPQFSSAAPTITTSASKQVVTLDGSGFLPGATVVLRRSGQADVPCTNVEPMGSQLRFRFDPASVSGGSWAAVVTNPDGQNATKASIYTAPSRLVSETFEAANAQWTSQVLSGSGSWQRSTQNPYAGSYCNQIIGSTAASDVVLLSPSVSIPSNASTLQLFFWHSFVIEPSYDGAVLEYAVDSGAWTRVTTSSVLKFISGGYNSSLRNRTTDNPLGRNTSCWTSSVTTYSQVEVAATSMTAFVGKNLRFRWRLATDTGGTASTWNIDNVELVATVPENQSPTVVSTAAAAQTVTGSSTSLSALGADDGGETSLTYTWSTTAEMSSGVQFSANGTNAAKNVTATFSRSGVFPFTVTVRDVAGLSATNQISVTVVATPTQLQISPTSVVLESGQTQQFSVSAVDQFGLAVALTSQPQWSAQGGIISASGSYVAGSIPGSSYVITAQAGQLSAQAMATVRVFYQLSLRSGSSVAGNVTGSGRYEHGDLASIEASVFPGYVFVRWSALEPGAVFGDSAAASTTVQMTASWQITAEFANDLRDTDADGLSNFAEVVLYGTNPAVVDSDGDGFTDMLEVQSGSNPMSAESLPQHSLTLGQQGVVTGGTFAATGTMVHGTYASVIATPAAGYRFDHWSGDATGQNAQVFVLMDADKSVMAHFAADLADADADGLSNYAEMLLGMSPDDPQQCLRMELIPLNNATARLSINRVVPQGTFEIQSSAALDGIWQTWKTLSVPVAQDQWQETVPVNQRRQFFRLRWLIPEP